MTIDLVGTPRQIEYAMDIIHSFKRRYPSEALPDNRSSSFWIEHRDASLEELMEAHEHAVFMSPFTTTYPRYGRRDAVAVLQAIESMHNVVVLDSETTGLGKDDEITELAIVAMNSGDILFDHIIRPSRLDRQPTIAKISPSELEQAFTFIDYWSEIEPILTSNIAFAYNAPFDFGMILRSAGRYNIAIPALQGTCLMRLFSAFMNTNDSYKLAEACQAMDIDIVQFGDLHHALADTRLARTLLLKMMQDI